MPCKVNCISSACECRHLAGERPCAAACEPRDAAAYGAALGSMDARWQHAYARAACGFQSSAERARPRGPDLPQPTLRQVFGKVLVCKDLDVAGKAAHSSNLNCVTIKGDQVSKKGTITGGYRDAKRCAAAAPRRRRRRRLRTPRHTKWRV